MPTTRSRSVTPRPPPGLAGRWTTRRRRPGGARASAAPARRAPCSRPGRRASRSVPGGTSSSTARLGVGALGPQRRHAVVDRDAAAGQGGVQRAGLGPAVVAEHLRHAAVDRGDDAPPVRRAHPAQRGQRGAGRDAERGGDRLVRRLLAHAALRDAGLQAEGLDQRGDAEVALQVVAQRRPLADVRARAVLPPHQALLVRAAGRPRAASGGRRRAGRRGRARRAGARRGGSGPAAISARRVAAVASARRGRGGIAARRLRARPRP